MRLRVEQVALVGTTRAVEFAGGLNVILGDTTTGKTSLMRLLRVLLGSDYDGIIPELNRVSDVAAALVIGEEAVSVVRRLTQTPTAPVDVATDDFSARLPAMRSERAGRETYGQWLLDRLELPSFRVPTAPTRPAESATTPVSIADYLRYCRLTQDEIDKDTLGSSSWPRDYKRRVVFRIYFGSYDAKVAQLQESLRQVESEMRELQSGTSAFDRFLAGTALANRAELERRRRLSKERVEEAVRRQNAVVADAPRTPEAEEARASIRTLDERIDDLRRRLSREQQAAIQLEDLGRQLRAQSARLTKAVVSASQLVDFEFRVCPRCGEPVSVERADEDHCLLCLQQPTGQLSREGLLLEQTRLEAQIDETGELVGARRKAVVEIETALAEAENGRVVAAERLGQATRRFVSDKGDEIAAAAAEEAAAKAELEQFTTYIDLLDKADRARAKGEQLRERRTRLDDELRTAERVSAASESRIGEFEQRFAELVEELRLPEFEEEADPRAAINRADYQPIVNGRRIEQHSGGMRVLVNVAHMLALHRTALERDLKIPGLLMIDGINQNLGRGEYDSERYDLVWRQLAAFHESYAEDLQIIVASNDIPDFIDELDVVRLRLSEEDRLVPEETQEEPGDEEGTGDPEGEDPGGNDDAPATP